MEFRRVKITSAIHRKLAKNACFSGVLASVVPASLLKLFLCRLMGPWGGKPVSSTGAFSYSASQVTEASGVVRITAQKSGNGWVGGILSTDTTRTFQYGYVEVRAKLPAGQGFWPAIWIYQKPPTRQAAPRRPKPSP